MTAQDKAREVRNKIKEEVDEKNVAEAKSEEAAKNALAVLADNSDLAKMYNDSAKEGAENLGGSAPWLKVHATGKSSSNFLENGSMPTDGNFFYAPSQEEFKTLKVHILTISRGFRTLEKDPKTGEVKKKFNQLIGGIITNNNDPRPFIMFMNGKKLNPMWEFGKEVSKWTQRKPIAVPMFALTVNLSTHMEKNDYSYSWLIDFEIEKEQDQPILVLDPGKFQFLKDSVAMIEEQINSFILAKESSNRQTAVEAEPEDDYIPPTEADGEGIPVSMG